MTWTRRGVLSACVAGTAGCLGTLRRPRRNPFDAGTADARIGFVGDAMLGRDVNRQWVDRDPAGVWGTTLDRLRSLDGLVVNLECCVSDRGQRWPEKTFYFRANPSFAVPALTAAETSVAALANNHVLDFREPALRDTLSHLDDAGIAHAGAGVDLEAALSPAVADVGGLTVATISLTDRFAAYAATAESPGTVYAPLDPTVHATRSLVEDALARADEYDPDLVVASLHWGPNWETSPDSTQRAFGHWLVEAGVDVVHGHSAHVLQGVEVFQGRPIIYDAGDFVDDYVEKEDLHNNRSALFELSIVDGRFATLDVVPIEIEDETAVLADENVATWVRETMRERSEPFGTQFEHTDDGVSIPLESNRRDT